MPGGMMCQWLPIYEMSVDNLKSVVKTFSQSFPYTMMWLTLYDAELVGSNEPIIIDESLLENKIAFSPVALDLESVMMGSATDFLSYFLMGTNGMRAFGRDGIINTDDNLYLEFSTPLVLGKRVMSNNILALTRYRESILPYLVPDQDINERTRQKLKWTEIGKAETVFDRAQALFVGDYYGRPEFRHLLEILENRYPQFAPGKFLKKEYIDTISKIPRLIQRATFALLDKRGNTIKIKISAVIAPVNDLRAAAVFVDNDKHVIFGKHYLSGPRVEQSVSEFISDVMTAIRNAYRRETDIALSHGEKLPSSDTFNKKIRAVINRINGER